MRRSMFALARSWPALVAGGGAVITSAMTIEPFGGGANGAPHGNVSVATSNGSDIFGGHIPYCFALTATRGAATKHVATEPHHHGASRSARVIRLAA
jgi:hypothetical protein